MQKSIYTFLILVLPFLGQTQIVKSFGIGFGSVFGYTDITYSSGNEKRIINYASPSFTTFIEFVSHENINLGIVAGHINASGSSEKITLRLPNEGVYNLSQNYIGARIKGRIKVSNSLKAFAIVEPSLTIYRDFLGMELNLFQYYEDYYRLAATYGVGIEQDMKRISLSYNVLTHQLFKDDFNSATEDFYSSDIERIDLTSFVARIDIKYKLFLPKRNSLSSS
ncbi:MAG: hypothetical protein JKY42_08875 [Flavobacteriales bacterium]|nr:hypothetical protein [Flavobacteriales bacterium]